MLFIEVVFFAKTFFFWKKKKKERIATVRGLP
jgi:hypothetical protein